MYIICRTVVPFFIIFIKKLLYLEGFCTIFLYGKKVEEITLKILTLIDSNWVDKEVDLSASWINISNVYYKKLSEANYLLIDSFYNLIDIVPQSVIRIDDGNLYTSLSNRYNTYMSSGIDGIKDVYNANLNKILERRKITVFTICPTYSCNMACIYCFERRYDTSNEVISQEKLNQLLEHLENEIKKIRVDDPSHTIRIEFFGGEPLQKETQNIVKQVLMFARKLKCELSIVTNGYLLCEYAPLLIQYRDLLVEVMVTLDGPKEIHNLVRRSRKGNDDAFQKIVQGIDLYLKLEIPINVSTNVDRNNAGTIKQLFDFYNQMNWVNNPYFVAEIGRVYDRPASKESSNIMSEVDIIKIFLEMFPDGNGPKWLRFGFLKITEQVAQKFHIAFNQDEYGRVPFHYCWSTSPVITGYYIDPFLNTFRCTTTVGFFKYSLGNINDIDYKSFNNSKIWGNSNVFTHKECLSCNIGGFCGGGCVLEREARGKQICFNEKKTFERFIDEIIVPIVKNVFDKLSL